MNGRWAARRAHRGRRASQLVRDIAYISVDAAHRLLLRRATCAKPSRRAAITTGILLPEDACATLPTLPAAMLHISYCACRAVMLLRRRLRLAATCRVT